jgi:hypothetical protein
MLSGSLRILYLYDVCEEIRFGQLAELVGAGPRRNAGSGHHSPEYIRFERPPVIQQLGPVTFEAGSKFNAELDYYEYGAVSLKLELRFHDLSWPDLLALSNRWVANAELEAEAHGLVRRSLAKAQPAFVRPNDEWLMEDYVIVHLHNPALPDGSRRFRAGELIGEHGSEIARLVRGESARLSAAEEREILGSQMSYYPDDLLVVGWTAAFVCDTAEGATPTIQLLDYANSQLLEFRYYDAVLTNVMQRVHSSLEGRGLFARWRLSREAKHLNKIRLEVRELTERIDTSIKFLSDMFSARLYRMAAGKIGVDDYRRLVEGKLHTAGDLYTFMMDQFHASRAFILELMVVIILIIDLVVLFGGKPGHR